MDNTIKSRLELVTMYLNTQNHGSYVIVVEFQNPLLENE